MLTSEPLDQHVLKWRYRLMLKKTESYAEFLQKYGENANWEDWLAFLKSRPELEGFGWARSLAKLSQPDDEL